MALAGKRSNHVVVKYDTLKNCVDFTHVHEVFPVVVLLLLPDHLANDRAVALVFLIFAFICLERDVPGH